LYLQLVQQVRHAVSVGVLAEGDQLPTVKEVVGRLAINPNTVLKAYRELERDGLARGRPGVGTFVRRPPRGPDPADVARLRAELTRWVAAARAAGLGDDLVVGMVKYALGDRAEGVA